MLTTGVWDDPSVVLAMLLPQRVKQQGRMSWLNRSVMANRAVIYWPLTRSSEIIAQQMINILMSTTDVLQVKIFEMYTITVTLNNEFLFAFLCNRERQTRTHHLE